MDGFLVVDDRDGRVLAELFDPVEAVTLLERLEDDEPELAGWLCLVRFDAHEGSILGARSTLRIRPLL